MTMVDASMNPPHPTSDAGVHTPVLLAEVLHYLDVRPGLRYVDATIDGGGHARAILHGCAPDGVVLGIDRDPDLPAVLTDRLGTEIQAGRLQLATGNFRNLTEILSARAFRPVDGVLVDLGLSSYHLDCSGRGFTYGHDEPLDMRFDPAGPQETAAQLLATRDVRELTRLIGTFGEERFASRIARSVVAHRRNAPIRTTDDLLRIVEQSLPAKLRWRASRHAARVFQALRIAVNDELGSIADMLPQAIGCLAPGGRFVAISFHSLEDRLVKRFLRSEQQAGRVRLLTRKPVRASEQEIAVNSRAASAKLRAAERID
jgi:16S rRNA (cytosine1402-N4)-methyltransferase